MKSNARLIRQKKTVLAMIKIYCNKNHNTKNELCTECLELMEYAIKRIDGCKFANDKPNCGSCKIHCYKKDMKEKIVKAMRYAGPRMMIYHPVMAIEHLISKLKF